MDHIFLDSDFFLLEGAVIAPLQMNTHPIHITIIGFGNVGRCLANVLLQEGRRSYHINVIDTSDEIYGSLLDIGQSALVNKRHSIEWNKAQLLNRADFIFYSAGLPVPYGLNRNDKLDENRDIVHQVFSDFNPIHSPIIITLTNPLDVIAREILRVTKLPDKNVVGIGTMMESIRMEYYLSTVAQTPVENIRALVIGEHGDTMVPVLSQTYIGEKLVRKVLPEHLIRDCIYETRRTAHRIKETQGATYFTAANTAVSILQGFLDEGSTRSIISVYHSYDDIFYSIPVSLSKKGYVPLSLTLTSEELESLKLSKERIKSMEVLQH